jgi:hypothetical protein
MPDLTCIWVGLPDYSHGCPIDNGRALEFFASWSHLSPIER